MNKVFLDTNVLLDIILAREGAERAKKIMALAVQKKGIRVYASFLSMANIAYILRKNGNEACWQCIKELSKVCGVLPMTDAQMYDVLQGTPTLDFEDSLQIACADHASCDIIVTSNTRHFKPCTDIPVFSPEEFLSHCQTE